MANGAVFFDMDGTLIDSKNGIRLPTSKTMEAIRRLRDRGFLTVLATGRSKCYIPEEFWAFDGYITSNGAYAEVDGTPLFSEFVQRDALHALASYLDRIGINYMVEGQEACYVKDINEYYYKRMMERFNFPDHSYYPLTDLDCIQVNKLMVSYDRPEKAEQFMRDYGHAYTITGHPVNQSCDVSIIGITKGYGVRKVMEHFGLDRSSAYAFGDADNDLDMLGAVGTGIAMGEHTPALETVAVHITRTVRDEGIYEALVFLGLI